MSAVDKILTALGATEKKQMNAEALRKAVGLTMRGFRIVSAKMEDDRLIRREFGRPNSVLLTFGGMQRLRVLNDSWEG